MVIQEESQWYNWKDGRTFWHIY